ncbi:MAG: DUF1906 domain-containing protein [Candidatus Cryosericum sp.]
MAKGLDYSFGRPDLDTVKQLGYSFVARYLAADGGNKLITRTEADQIRAHGLGLVLVYEQYAGRAKEGRVAGKADGQTALAQARSVGFPDTRPVYFAVDYEATEADQAAIDEYLSGTADSIGTGRVGVYGSYAVVERCFAHGSAQFFWQTSAWSAGQISTHAHILQYRNGQTVGRASVDLDESKQADFGAWGIPAPVSVPAPGAAPTVQPAARLSVAQQWAIDQGIITPPVDWNGHVDYNTLAWALMKARGKI